jgi:methionyl-tRNA synthetase
MSKSVGNVVDPMALADRFGVDALRYFLLREVPFGQDGSYSAEAIVNRANAELANSFGNLAQRTLSMIYKNLEGVLSQEYSPAQDDLDLRSIVRDAAVDLLPREFERFAFSVGIEEWLRAVFACNQYVDAQAPWALRKTDPERMRAVLMTLFRAVRALAIAIRPVVPASADKLLDQLGVPADARDFAALSDPAWFDKLKASGFTVTQPTPIFPRLELNGEEPA